MNSDEGLRTPSKKGRTAPASSPSNNTRGSAKKGTKNAKITNFFTKINSPLNRNNSNSNQEQSDPNQGDDQSKDESSSSMRIPGTHEVDALKSGKSREYVFIIPSSDDDTKGSHTQGSTAKRGRVPSLHSSNSKSSDGLILTITNNELGLGHKKGMSTIQEVDKRDSNSNHDATLTPSRSSGRDSRSRDSVPGKRLKTDQNTNQNSPQKKNRITPTLVGVRTKMIDFQSVPSDLNMPREQASGLIEELFLVRMPEDFFLFWDFAKTINHRKPCSAFSQAHLEWNLVGPFHVLSGLITNFHGFSKDSLLRHCRYYYDPPQFQTVIDRSDSNLTHYGYWRDEPKSEKPIVVTNCAALGGQFSEAGDNLFTLLKDKLDASIGALSKSSQDIPSATFSSKPSSTSSTPAKSTRGKSTSSSSASSNEQSCGNKQSQLEIAKAKQELTIIRDKLIDFCRSHKNLSYESWSRTNKRRARCRASTLNTIGVILRHDEGVFRRVIDVDDAEFESMLTKISDFKDDKAKFGPYRELKQLIDDANFASFDQNFGLALKLGLDLFYNGDSFFHKDIVSLLTKVYKSLNWTEFIEVLNSHIDCRVPGEKVSLLDI